MTTKNYKLSYNDSRTLYKQITGCDDVDNHIDTIDISQFLTDPKNRPVTNDNYYIVDHCTDNDNCLMWVFTDPKFLAKFETKYYMAKKVDIYHCNNYDDYVKLLTYFYSWGVDIVGYEDFITFL